MPDPVLPAKGGNSCVMNAIFIVRSICCADMSQDSVAGPIDFLDVGQRKLVDFDTAKSSCLKLRYRRIRRYGHNVSPQ